jgi:phenylalanyl-tRNA synthetase alpha chain
MAEEDDEGPSPTAAPLTLSELERAVLMAVRERAPTALPENEVAELSRLPLDAVRGTLQRLRSKHLIVVEETHASHPELTRRGQEAAERGLPERRLFDAIAASPTGIDPGDLLAAGFTPEERSAAIGVLRRRGLIEDGVPLRARAGSPSGTEPIEEEVALSKLRAGEPVPESDALRQLVRRGLAQITHETERRWAPSEEGRAIVLATEAGSIGALTPALLVSGEWTERPFRPYDVRANVAYLHGARPHPYVAWVREFEEILIGLGFEQSEGPLVETAFWNADVLFMPQDHPARSVHDMLAVQGLTGRLPDDALVDRVAAAHEGRALSPGEDPLGPGWGARYDRSLASIAIPRSQTTAVSARYLSRNPRPPFRMYSLDRNFRQEAVDATHHIEFGQCEGILGGEGINLRHLIGMFREVAQAIGIHELKFRPSYFPFTEPSIEGYIRHPRLGWIEVFPGGMFRPEVTRPLGITVPVAAWGIGITRLAMVALGVNDIRELFMTDLERLTHGPM